MANFVDVTNLTYEGEYAKEIFIKNLYESKLKNFGITYMPGVKGKQQLVSGDVSDLFQKFTCPFSASGEAELTEKWIEGVPMKVNLEQCYDSFWSTFLAAQTEVSLNGGVPQAFFDWFFNGVLVPELGREYEQIFWNGDKAAGATDTLKIADGIVKQLNADAKVNKVTGAVLTVDNILAQVEAVALKAMDAATETEMEDYKLFMNVNDFRLLKVALSKEAILGDQVWANFGRDGEKIYAFGFEVVPCLIAKNAMILAPAKNLVLGYDIADSEISYKMIDMRQTTLDNTFRVGVITNIAIGYVYPELIVVSKPA
jgi:hypothetical protein